MQIRVNGEKRALEKPLSVTDLLRELDIDEKSVLVELNGVALLQKELPASQVDDGATIELIRIVAGG